MPICPSARDGVDVSKIIRDFIKKDFYKQDYQDITEYFAKDPVKYEDCIEQMEKIASWIETME